MTVLRAVPGLPVMHAAPASGRRIRRLVRPLLRDGVRPLLVGGDLLACLVATLLVGAPTWVGALFAIAVVGFYASGGLYRSRLALSLLDDMPSLLGRWMVAAVLVLFLAAPGPWFDLHPERPVVAMAVLASSLVIAGRALCYAFVRRLRAMRVVAHPTLILGAGQVGQDIAAALLAHPEYGLAPTGFVDSARRGRSATLSLPVVGTPAELPLVLEKSDLRAVVLAYGRMGERDLVDLVRTCHRHRCEVFVVPRLYELHQVSQEMEFLWGTPLVRLRRAAHRSPAWRLKRLIDIVFASVALIGLSPLMAACAAAVYREGGPGVIFRQERVGCDGRRFWLMKFRSLRPADEHESAVQWTIGHDERIGPVGRVLRVTSLDELPQLFNILRGDMSIVGPRPERPHFVEDFRARYPSYMARHRVPCGLTGWAQVHGLRGDTSIDERARFDNFYIENWSLWLDLKIILRTAVSVVRSPGA